MKTKPTPATNDSIAVTSVEITIAGTKLLLTLDQVKELKQTLAKAFPEPEIKTVHVPGPERTIFRERPPMQWTQQPDPRKMPFRFDEIMCREQALEQIGL